MAARPEPGKRTLTEMLSATSSPAQRKADSGDAAVQRKADAMPTASRPSIADLFGRRAELFAACVQHKATGADPDTAAVHESAQRCIATSASPLPHLDTIQRAFGRHDVSGIQAHVGGEAAASARAMGVQAYATGAHVVLGEGANLHTVAHEAAHIVQQRRGVQLKGGLGEAPVVQRARAPIQRVGPADAVGAWRATPAEALQLAWQGTRTELPYRAILEQRYGTTLQNLEVYSGKPAAQACAMMHAQAFAVGNIIVLASETLPLEVVAHEVTHALQQGGDKQPLGATPSNLGMSRESDSAEHDAHEQGQAAAAAATQSGGSKPALPDKAATAGQRAFQEGDSTGTPVLSRFPAPPDCHTFRPGLAFMSPIIKAGYDGNTYTAIKTGWETASWERRWQIYDAEDALLYESHYTWPSPTLKIPQDVVVKGKAGGKERPWSVWIKVTKPLVPFGDSDNANFPHAYMKFNVYNTWDEFLADPDANPGAVKPPVGPNGKPAGNEAGDKAPSGSVVASPGAKAAGSVADYGSVVAMNEAYLREIYDASAKQLSELAQDLVKQGAPQKDVADWATKARNSLKANIRDQGSPILKRVFEQRNLTKYGDKLGPSYEQLYAKYAKSGLTPDEINAKIIQGAGKANAGFNRWAGRLKFAGRLALALDICLAAVRVYMAPEGEKVKTALQEVARIGGALALGAAGAEAGAALGAAIGAAFAGVGAVPGAVIGGIAGGIGGAILGGYLAEELVAKLYEMFPPDDCEFEGDFTEGVKEQ